MNPRDGATGRVFPYEGLSQRDFGAKGMLSATFLLHIETSNKCRSRSSGPKQFMATSVFYSVGTTVMVMAHSVMSLREIRLTCSILLLVTVS
jgi:hypothetical protein